MKIETKDADGKTYIYYCSVQKINNQEWKIFEVRDKHPKLKDNNKFYAGMTHFVTQEIYIAKRDDLETEKELLRHELTHAFLYAFGFKIAKDFSEEELAEFIALYGQQICNMSEMYFTWLKVQVQTLKPHK